MKNYFRFNKLFRVALIIIIGIIALKRFIYQADHEFVFDEEVNLLIYSVLLIGVVWIIYEDTMNYGRTKKLIAFIPTYIGCAFLISLFIAQFLLAKRDKSPIILSCVSKATDFNGIRFDFRADGTYKIGNFCMGADYYRGTYTMKDSIITLDKANQIGSNLLVIRPETHIYEKDTVKEKSIYQIDNKGRIISAQDFRVIDK